MNVRVRTIGKMVSVVSVMTGLLLPPPAAYALRPKAVVEDRTAEQRLRSGLEEQTDQPSLAQLRTDALNAIAALPNAGAKVPTIHTYLSNEASDHTAIAFDDRTNARWRLTLSDESPTSTPRTDTSAETAITTSVLDLRAYVARATAIARQPFPPTEAPTPSGEIEQTLTLLQTAVRQMPRLLAIATSELHGTNAPSVSYIEVTPNQVAVYISRKGRESNEVPGKLYSLDTAVPQALAQRLTQLKLQKITFSTPAMTGSASDSHAPDLLQALTHLPTAVTLLRRSFTNPAGFGMSDLWRGRAAVEFGTIAIESYGWAGLRDSPAEPRSVHVTLRGESKPHLRLSPTGTVIASGLEDAGVGFDRSTIFAEDTGYGMAARPTPVLADRRSAVRLNPVDLANQELQARSAEMPVATIPQTIYGTTPEITQQLTNLVAEAVRDGKPEGIAEGMIQVELLPAITLPATGSVVVTTTVEEAEILMRRAGQAGRAIVAILQSDATSLAALIDTTARAFDHTLPAGIQFRLKLNGTAVEFYL